MQKSSLIGHSIELLDAVHSTTQPADGVVKEFFRARHYLGSKDRRFIAESLFGMLRHYRFIDVVASDVLRSRGPVTPRRPAIVDYGVYAVRLLGEDIGLILADIAGLWRVYLPDIDCRDAVAAISNVVATPEKSADPVTYLGVVHSFPERIVKEWVDRFGVHEAEQLCKALNTAAPTTIRVNTLKTTVEECQRRLANEGVTTTRASMSPWALHLEKRINVHAHSSYKEGLFEMQDEGSQLVSMLLNVRAGHTVVDACAGGGGKTVHLGALMKNEGVLLALDADEKRLASIRPRLQRAGITCARLQRTDADGDAILAFKGNADAVLIDAPCTGVGIFRRNPGAKRTFTPSFVESVARTQRDILEKYCTLVRPGGVLVYSTCTLLHQENEDQVGRFLGEHQEFALTSATGILANHGVHVDSNSPYLALFPHRSTTDGFFAAVMTRR
jgi:16S rRNA (cytosine967-C5)-methyltransferase